MTLPRRKILVWLGALLLGALVLLMAGGLWLVNTQAGARYALTFALHQISARSSWNLETGQSTGTLLRGLQLRSVQLSDSAGTFDMTVQVLEFSWQPLQLLQGTLHVDDLLLQGMRMQIQTASNAAANPLTPAMVRDWFVQLPVGVALGSSTASNLQVRVDEQEFNVELLQLTGNLQPQALTLDTLVLELYDTRVEGNVQLDAALSLTGNLEWQYQTGNQGVNTYSGAVELGGDLSQLQLQHSLQLPFELLSSGELTSGLFDDTTPAVALQHELAELNLADYGEPESTLTETVFTTTGTLDDLEVAGTARLQARDFAPAQIQWSAVYTPELVTLTTAAIASDEIQAGFTGTWTIGSRQLELAWALDELSLAAYVPQLQLEALAGNGQLSLASADAGIAGVVALGPLQGTLNGFPLQLSGTVAVDESAVQSVALVLDNGDNRLQVEGELVPELALEWSLQAPRLEGFWNGLSGKLEGEGRLTGTTAAPLLAGQVQGAALRLASQNRNFLLDSLTLTAEASNADNRIELQLDDFTVEQAGEQQQWLQTGQVLLTGTLQEHQVDVQLQGQDSELQLELAGEASNGNWQGTLDTADIDSPFGSWRLFATADMQMIDDNFMFGRQCWAQGSLELCATASATATSGLDAQVALTGVPLSWFNPGTRQPEQPEALRDWQQEFRLVLPQGLQISGTADIAASIQGWQGGNWQRLQAEVQPRALMLQVEPTADNGNAASEVNAILAEDRQFQFDGVMLRASNENAIWQGTLVFEVMQGNFFGELQMDTQENLQGNFTVAFPELAWLESLYPGLRGVQGELYGTAAIAGTRTEPELTSQVQVGNGAFALPGYGVQVSGLDLALTSSREQAVLDISAQAPGEGSLQLHATVLQPLQADRSVAATIKGSSFLVYDTDRAKVKLSPDLEFSLVNNTLVTSGRLLVPEAFVDLDAWVSATGAGAVGTSRDVVVVVDDPAATVDATGQSLPLNLQMALEFGENVSLSGFGLEASLKGELALEQNQDRPLFAYGELAIPTGSYRIYNQELEARDGRLLFFGNPFNPVLDVRAFRETSSAEVGMQLSGSLSRIQGKLYSTPVLPENEVLAMLITGKAFNNLNDQDGSALVSAIADFGIERGEGLTSMISNQLGLDDVSINSGATYLDSSLGLGKYLTPDLLMRYEVGLFDRQVVLSIDYTLSERVKLEVRSGVSQSVDLSYTIEKD